MKTIKDLKDWLAETTWSDDTLIMIEINSYTGQGVPIDRLSTENCPASILLIPDMSGLEQGPQHLY